MGLTSRERVLAAFDHREPDRVPIWVGSSSEFWDKARARTGLDDEALRVRLGDDFRRVWARYAGPDFPLAEGATCRTIFGVQRHGMGYGQPMHHPLSQADVMAVHEHAWPAPGWMDVSQMRAEAQAWGGQYAILGGDWSPFWHDAIDLMGMEGLLVAMHEQPAVVDAVFEHLVAYYAAVSRRIFEAAGSAIDVFFIGNDFGSQCGPLLSPAAFERFILRHLRRLIELGHAYRLKVMLHCCGGYAQLIPMMIEAGLDAVHAVQPSCRGMELRELKERYGRKLVFNGAIDSHHVLIKGTPASIRESVREVLAVMMPGGGYIAGASHDSILEETPVENVLAMCDAVMEYGRYG